MATAVQKKQKFIRYFREQTGAKEWNMHDVAIMAHKMGWPLPKPLDPLDLLAKQFADLLGVSPLASSSGCGSMSMMLRARRW
jgi:hypothetical protein